MQDIEEINDRGFGEILNALNAGVYITDTERRIVFWNRRAEEITGHAAEEVKGRRCSARILQHTDKDGRPLCSTDLCPLLRAMVHERSDVEPVVVYALSKDGERLALSTSVAPVFSHDGRVIGGVEVFRDERESIREMELARAVQRQMLTRDLPQDERIVFDVQYAPRDMIGGDFYHFSRLSDDEFAVFLGDAAGHGPAAALYTSLVYGLLAECSEALADPAVLLGELNDRACRRAGGLGFFTAVALTINAANGRLSYSLAGHPPLLLQRAADGGVTAISTPQLPIGVTDEASYENDTVTLQSGDRVIAYTDGVTDLQIGEEKRVGTDGLARLMEETPPRENNRLEELYEALLKRCVTVTPDDDMTLLGCLIP